MDWHDRFYPADVFPSLLDLVDGLINAGRFAGAELVKDELAAMGSASLKAWSVARSHIFDPTANHLAEALRIEGQFPQLKDPNASYEEADAYVIAIARIRNAIVVTAETPAANKRKPRRSMYIPDVCAALGMPSITNLGLMRRERWRL